MKSVTKLGTLPNPLLSYNQLSVNTLYIVRGQEKWAKGKIFIPKNSPKTSTVDGYVFDEFRIADVSWCNSQHEKMFELAPSGTTVTLTQE